MKAFQLSWVTLGFLIGCSPAPSGDPDANMQPHDAASDVIDAAQPNDTGAPADTGTPLDAGEDAGTPTDTGAPLDAPSGNVSAQYVGTYVANMPTSTPCFVTLFNNTVVTVDAVDDDTVRISDGAVTIQCDIANGQFTCAQAAASSTVQIGPQTFCEWPYTVTATVQNASPTSFNAFVQFATQMSTTTQTCGATLGVCMGQGTATFTKYVMSPQQPNPPPRSAIAKKTGA